MVLVMLVLEEDKGFETLTSVMEVRNNNNNPRAPNARQTVLPFVEPPIPRPSKYKEFGLPKPKKQLSIKIIEKFNVFRGQKNHVDGIWYKCKWCNNLYGPNVTCLTQHFTSKFAPRQRGNMELPAFKREESNKHIKGCERASEQLKLEIRAMNNRERDRATKLASLHDMESTSHALDQEEREIEPAFLGSIRGEPSSTYAGNPEGSDASHARPHKTKFSSLHELLMVISGMVQRLHEHLQNDSDFGFSDGEISDPEEELVMDELTGG
ncbi:hypothetical protein R1flu_017922 [Riccia fluitans]|uniref:BED-type domain-containing protein n=1 Tax=Riccia fluitans TaxID=41844 RepID=A0ABD1ZHR5_9MARC